MRAVANHGQVLENGRISLHGDAAKLRDDLALKVAYLGGTEEGPPVHWQVTRPTHRTCRLSASQAASGVLQ